MIIVAPLPFGNPITRPAGKPCPACMRSRIMRSIPVRRPLFSVVICVAESVALTASPMAAMVAPRMTVVIARDTISSTSVKPRSRVSSTWGEALECRIVVSQRVSQEIDEM